jgi:hypothetical protein
MQRSWLLSCFAAALQYLSILFACGRMGNACNFAAARADSQEWLSY